MNRLVSTVACALTLCLVLASAAAADSFTFAMEAGGTGVPAGPWATVSLSLDTTSPGCAVAGDPCIQFTGNALGDFAFYNQDNETGLLGFNENASLGNFGNLQVLDCAPVASCTVSNPATYPFFGTFQYSVDPLVGPSSGNLDLYTTTSFSFDVLPQAGDSDFTTVSDLLALSTGTAADGHYDLASHVCDTGVDPGTAPCENNSTSGFPVHAYLSDPVPEPTTVLLLGTGIVGIIRYRRRTAA